MTPRAKTNTDLSHVYYWKTINVETVSASKWKMNNKCFPLYFIYKYKQRNVKTYKDNVRVMRNVTLDHTGNYDPPLTRRHTDTYPDCTNGFCLQMKGENVRIKARGF